MLEILELGPILLKERDTVLLDAILWLGEQNFIDLIQTARKHDPISPKIDSAILEFAAIRGSAKLVESQLQHGFISQESADASLFFAAKQNHRKIVQLLLTSSLCTQHGVNKAARKAIKWNSAAVFVELLEQKSVSGMYTHSDEDDEEPIRTVLLRDAGMRGHLAMTRDLVTYFSSDALTSEDRGYLAIAATLAQNKQALLDLYPLGPIDTDLRDEAICQATQRGWLEFVPLLRKAPVS